MFTLAGLWSLVNGKYGPLVAGMAVLAIIAAAVYFKVTPGYILAWLGL